MKKCEKTTSKAEIKTLKYKLKFKPGSLVSFCYELDEEKKHRFKPSLFEFEKKNSDCY